MQVDSILQGRPAFVTLSAQDIREQAEYALAVKTDWWKVGAYVRGEWPAPWPKPHLLGRDAVADRKWFLSAEADQYAVFDVENHYNDKDPYDPKAGWIYQVGLYAPSVGPAIWDRDEFPDYPFADHFRKLIGSTAMVAHNAPHDVAHIGLNFGVQLEEYAELHDTIIMHGLLWSEYPHSMAFIASVLSPHSKVKHLGPGSYDYLVGDVVDTAIAFESLWAEMESEPGILNFYQNTMTKLLCNMIRYMRRGVAVDADFVEACLEWIPQEVEFASKLAEAYCGFPILLTSAPQLRAYLDGAEDIFKEVKKRTGSGAKKSLTEKGELSFGKDTVNALRGCFVPLPENEDLSVDYVVDRIAQGAHPLLEAKALHGRARVLMSNYIKPLLIPLTEKDGAYHYKGTLHVGGGKPRYNREKGTENA